MYHLPSKLRCLKEITSRDLLYAFGCKCSLWKVQSIQMLWQLILGLGLLPCGGGRRAFSKLLFMKWNGTLSSEGLHLHCESLCDLHVRSSAWHWHATIFGWEQRKILPSCWGCQIAMGSGACHARQVCHAQMDAAFVPDPMIWALESPRTFREGFPI